MTQLTADQQDFISLLQFIAVAATVLGGIAVTIFGIWVALRKKYFEAQTDEAKARAETSKKQTALTDLQITREQDERDKLTKAISELASGFNSFSQATAQNSMNTDKLFSALDGNTKALQDVASALSGYKSEFQTATSRMEGAQKGINDHTDARADEIKDAVAQAAKGIEKHMDEKVEKLIKELPDAIQAMFSEIQELRTENAAQKARITELELRVQNQAGIIQTSVIEPILGEKKLDEPPKADGTVAG